METHSLLAVGWSIFCGTPWSELTILENCQLFGAQHWSMAISRGLGKWVSMAFHDISCPCGCANFAFQWFTAITWCCWHQAPGISCFPWSRALSLHSSIGSRAWFSRCSGAAWSFPLSPTPTGQIPGFSLIRVSHGITTYYLYSAFIQSLGDRHNPWESPKKHHHSKGSYDVEPIWNSIPEAHRRKTPRFWYVKSSRNRPCSSVFQSYVRWRHWRVSPPFVAFI